MTQYYSKSKGKFIDIANMPDQYVRNAFVKMCSEESRWKKLAEDNFIASVDDLEENEIMVNSLTKERDDLIKERDKLNQHVLDMVSKKVYNIMWDNCQRIEKKLEERDQ